MRKLAVFAVLKLKRMWMAGQLDTEEYLARAERIRKRFYKGV